MLHQSNINLPSASKQLVNTGGCLVWHATLETTGIAAAEYRLWDGSSAAANGQLLLPIALSAGQSTRDYMRPHVVTFRTGLYFELVSGSVQGAVGVMLGHECADWWELVAKSLVLAELDEH